MQKTINATQWWGFHVTENNFKVRNESADFFVKELKNVPFPHELISRISEHFFTGFDR